MIFQKILLEILNQLQQERTISAPFHLLKGKRSGQTIQDVGIFHLHQYFGILPKLSRAYYNQEIARLIQLNDITTNQEGYYKIGYHTDIQRDSIPFFDGWHYRGNEHIFFGRLSLIIQSLSHKRKGKMKFSPIQKDEEIQRWVRHFLMNHHYEQGDLQKQFFNEIYKSLQATQCEERSKTIVINRLTGFQLPGYTWGQLSYMENMSEMDVYLLYISCLHSWLNEIDINNEKYPLLTNVAENIRFKLPLTESAMQTANLFKRGYSIEQISNIRRLKKSTIEDHLVELAMNDGSFSYESFISNEDLKKVLTVTEQYETKKLKVIHEVLPHLSYFQIRLALTRGARQ